MCIRQRFATERPCFRRLATIRRREHTISIPEFCMCSGLLRSTGWSSPEQHRGQPHSSQLWLRPCFHPTFWLLPLIRADSPFWSSTASACSDSIRRGPPHFRAECASGCIGGHLLSPPKIQARPYDRGRRALRPRCRQQFLRSDSAGDILSHHGLGCLGGGTKLECTPARRRHRRTRLWVFAFWLTPSYLKITRINLQWVAQPGNNWSMITAAILVAFFCGN